MNIEMYSKAFKVQGDIAGIKMPAFHCLVTATNSTASKIGHPSIYLTSILRDVLWCSGVVVKHASS